MALLKKMFYIFYTSFFSVIVLLILHDVTFQSNDVELFKIIIHDSFKLNYLVSLPCSDVCCQRTELKIRVGKFFSLC